jgi:heme A synthase
VGTLRNLSVALIVVVVAQLCLGVVNLVLMAPVPVQLLHLLLADLLWICFVLLAVELLAPTARQTFALTSHTPPRSRNPAAV